MADFFKWDEQSLGLKIKSMDDEHIQLIHKMNLLHSAHTENASTERINRLLMDFVDYTVKHFADEEAYMEKVNYAGLDSHKLIHAKLLGRVTDFVEEYKKTGKLTDDFFRFLSAWLNTHIRGIDMKYSPNYSEKAS